MIRYSLAEVPGGGGWKNYEAVLTSGTFQRAIFNTLRFIGIGVTALLVVSMILALIARKKIPGMGLLRPVLLFPMMIPVGAIVMVITWLLTGDGVLNRILRSFGMPECDWMGSSAAFLVLIVLYLWKYAGYDMILLLTGLNTISREQTESAALDGANGWQIYFRITLPQLVPVLFFTFVISVVNSFKIYREAFLLGGMRPDRSIYMLQHFLNNNFDNLNYQRLSVAAIVVFVFLFLLTAVLYLVQRRYGEDV